MISVFRGCKLRFERFWISKQLEFLWVYCIHKCAKSTQIFRHQLSHIRPVIHAFYFQFWFFIPEVSCVRITLPLPENPAKFEWTWLIFCAVLHKLYTTICLWKDPMLWKTSADGFCSSAFLIDDSSWSWVHQNKKQRTNSSWLICGTIRKIEYESGKEKSDGCGVSLRRRARK